MVCFSLPVFSQQCFCDQPNAIIIGAPGVTTNVSDAITQGDLVPLPGASTIPQNICIRGILNVNIAEYVFTSSNINMAPGASITVNFNNKLTIDHSSIYGCGEMWDRINVFPFASLNITSSNLSDAENAIAGTFYSSLIIQNNTFQNNHVGIFISSSFLGLPGVILSKPVTGNTFKTNGTLLPPHTGEIGFAGVHLINQPGFTIGTTNTGATPNIFENLKNGIYSNQSSFAVHGANFENMPAGNGVFIENRSSLFITNCSFETLFHGIRAINSSIDASFNAFHSSPLLGIGTFTGIRADLSHNAPIINIHHNNINTLRWGLLFVEMSGASIFNVSDNDIEVGDPAIDPVFSGFSGIEVNNSAFFSTNQAIIQNNTVDMYSTAGGINTLSCQRLRLWNNNVTIHSDPGPLVAHGLIIQNCKDMNVLGNAILSVAGSQEPLIVSGIFINETTSSRYCCNTVNGTFNGIIFDGTCTGTCFRGNIFGDAQVGLLYRQDARTGTQTNANNLWPVTSNFGDVAARHQTTDQTFLSFSIYRVNPFSPPTLPPSIDAVSQWFFSWGQPPNFSCPSTNCGVIDTEIPPADEADLIIADGNWDSGLPWQNNLEWNGERYLLDKLDAFPALMQNNVSLQNFHADKQGTTVDQFNEFDNGIKELASLSTDEYSLYASNLVNNFSLLEDITEIDSLMFVATDSQAIVLQQNRDDLVGSLSLSEAENDSLQNIIQAARLSGIQQLISENNYLPAFEIFEQNEKTVKRIWLNTLAQGIYSFTSAQVSELENIVDQCPKFGGKAVYTARGMYSLIANKEYDDDKLCDEIQERGNRKPQSQTKFFRLIPNPASNQTTVFIDTSGNDPITIILTDIAGRIINSYSLPLRQNQYILNTSGLSQGIYFCKILRNQEQIEVQKLVISR